MFIKHFFVWSLLKMRSHSTFSHKRGGKVLEYQETTNEVQCKYAQGLVNPEILWYDCRLCGLTSFDMVIGKELWCVFSQILFYKLYTLLMISAPTFKYKRAVFLYQLFALPLTGEIHIKSWSHD